MTLTFDYVSGGRGKVTYRCTTCLKLVTSMADHHREHEAMERASAEAVLGERPAGEPMRDIDIGEYYNYWVV